MVCRSIVLCLALVFVANAQADDKPMVFKSKEGKFSVNFPAKPTEQKQKAKSALGDLQIYLFIVDQKDRGFIASYTDYPKGTVTKENLQKILDGGRDGNVKGIRGKLLSEKKLTLKKKDDGRELLIAMPGNTGNYRSRIYLVGDRLYQVIALGPADFAKSKAVDAYLNSFKLQD